MARLIGPDDSDRLVYVLNGTQILAAAGMTATVYAASTGDTLADILTDNDGTPGAAVPNSQLTVDQYGLLPDFWFPDGASSVWIQVGSGSRARVDAAFGGRIDAALPLAGGTLTGKAVVNATGAATGYPIGPVGATETGLSILSSFTGGEDDGTGTDSTGRINLYSFQRAGTRSFGEVMRIFVMRQDSKQMIATYGAQKTGTREDGYDNTTRDVLASGVSWKPWTWVGAHYEANDHGSVHGHWSIEIPDSTGAMQTRLEIPFVDSSGLIGIDKTVIKTNQADLNVRCSNGQELRLSASAGTTKPITFSNSSDGEDAYRRWQLRATNEAESGSNAGTNFQLARYDDTGTFVDVPIVVSRSTGNVTLTPGFVVRRSTSTVTTLSLNTTSLGGGQGVIAIGNAATVPASTPTGGGVLYTESGALKYKGSSGTVTVLANA